MIESAGNVPIPPYLNRKSEEIDNERYQTIYSAIDGSVAAPTAGLHFTDFVFRQLEKKNIDKAELTLHVGAGTFKPVSSETLKEHEMHNEYFSISKKLIEKLMNNEFIIATGTTSMRALESIYYVANKLDKTQSSENIHMVEQWEPYLESNNKTGRYNALKKVYNYLDINNMDQLICSTRIIIVPGYKFKFVKGLITNFHLPKSTLLLLVAAFAGEKWKEIYDYAIKHDFRFLSYGDSSILLP